MKYIALAGLLVLVLGLGTINIQHHMILPHIDSNRSTVTYFVNLQGIHKQTDIRLGDIIGDAETFKDVTEILYTAKQGDRITFHLAGYGGGAHAMYYLINNIKASKAYIKMIVEAPVYSAHAYIAVNGNELQMLPYTYLMFHTGSNYGFDCKTVTGTDRTVSNVEHCQKHLDILQAQGDMLINNISFLTFEEKISILTGHDVYITAQEYYSRIGV